MEQLLSEIGDHLVFVVIGTVFAFGMVLKAITTVVVNGSRERTRREVAAYIAEGSISAEQGERLLKADVNGLSTEIT